MTQAVLARERDGLFGNKPDAGSYVHYFTDDYRFQRCWPQPERCIQYLKGFAGTLSPDFRLFWDDPIEVQRWNCFRNRWLAAFWHANGIRVIPTISWSDESSFEWAFETWPVGGTVAVSTVGTQKRLEDRVRFMMGYREMLSRLQPSTVVVSGTETDLPGPVRWHEPFYTKFEGG